MSEHEDTPTKFITYNQFLELLSTDDIRKLDEIYACRDTTALEREKERYSAYSHLYSCLPHEDIDRMCARARDYEQRLACKYDYESIIKSFYSMTGNDITPISVEINSQCILEKIYTNTRMCIDKCTKLHNAMPIIIAYRCVMNNTSGHPEQQQSVSLVECIEKENTIRGQLTKKIQECQHDYNPETSEQIRKMKKQLDDCIMATYLARHECLKQSMIAQEITLSSLTNLQKTIAMLDDCIARRRPRLSDIQELADQVNEARTMMTDAMCDEQAIIAYAMQSIKPNRQEH